MAMRFDIVRSGLRRSGYRCSACAIKCAVNFLLDVTELSCDVAT